MAEVNRKDAPEGTLALAAPGGWCTGCVFDDNEYCGKKRDSGALCSGEIREDRNNVIFVKLAANPAIANLQLLHGWEEHVARRHEHQRAMISQRGGK